MPTIPRPTIPSLAGRQFPQIARGRGALVALGALALAAVVAPACATLPRPAALRGAVVAQPGGAAGQTAASAGRAPVPSESAASQRSAPVAAAPGVVGAAGASDAAKAAVPQANTSAAASAAAAAQAQQTTPDQQPLPPLPPNGQMVIKDGTLTLEVSDLADAMQRVNAAVAAIPGAYVSASSTTYRADTTAASSGASGAAQGRSLPPVPLRPVPSPAPGQAAGLTIKVPVDSFSDLLQRLRDTGKPLQENVSTQEVTEEYVDLDAQVRNLEATEQQYQQLLQRAQTIQEILPIQQRLADVRSQIERLRGRMNLLQRRADLSTITLTLLLPSQAETLAGAPQVVRTLQDALGRLVAVLLAALDGLIYVVVYALPLVPFALAYWWWRRNRRPSTGAATTAPTGAAM